MVISKVRVSTQLLKRMLVLVSSYVLVVCCILLDAYHCSKGLYGYSFACLNKVLPAYEVFFKLSFFTKIISLPIFFTEASFIFSSIFPLSPIYNAYYLKNQQDRLLMFFIL